MKQISMLLATVTLALLAGCGTVGGALEGAGHDLQSLGKVIKK
jgi:predicted small secreted protein